MSLAKNNWRKIILVALIVLIGSQMVWAEEQKIEEKKPEATEEKKPEAAKEEVKKEEAKPAKDMSKKVAIVNGVAIYSSEMEMALKQAKMQLMFSGRTLDDAQAAALEKETLETLIERELLLEESRKAGIKIDEAKINEKLEMMKKRFPDEEKFKQALAARNLSMEELKRQVNDGLTLQEFIEKGIAAKVTVTDEEAKTHYDQNQIMFKMPEQVKASHILIKLEPDADEAQKTAAHKKIEQIQERVKKGEDFAALAKETSQCPSAEQGGDLGFFARGRMVKPFEDTAFALNKDQVSDIVTSDFGYHLIKVTDKKPESTAPFEDVKNKLKDYMKSMKVEEQVRAYANKLKETAKIERFAAAPASSAPVVSAAPATPAAPSTSAAPTTEDAPKVEAAPAKSAEGESK